MYLIESEEEVVNIRTRCCRDCGKFFYSQSKGTKKCYICSASGGEFEKSWHFRTLTVQMLKYPNKDFSDYITNEKLQSTKNN